MAEDLILSIYPTVVYICAGMTWVDGCEKDPALANRLNCAGETVAPVTSHHRSDTHALLAFGLIPLAVVTQVQLS